MAFIQPHPIETLWPCEKSEREKKFDSSIQKRGKRHLCKGGIGRSMLGARKRINLKYRLS